MAAVKPSVARAPGELGATQLDGCPLAPPPIRPRGRVRRLLGLVVALLADQSRGPAKPPP
eukprot:CAMPEP_0185200940 /NCGR_PEP_ID=MMETSP1140-20130426/48329_1 /TAXON_ID=298111 /ORGANISM="Pavlova sp., Strain CCMP459" /LENGTH=59 /DNA_ID=CAMNT_0027768315 /DNA_START=114 /DNA_END=293 /DNA_ORIENTATION=+